MFEFLSHDWAGIVIALAIALIGGCLFKIGRRIDKKFFRRLLIGLGGFIFILGSILTVTSSIHAVSIAHMWAKYPAPGQLVDVGGYRMHIVAEGENKGNPTIIFIPGGHGAGYGFYNYHKIFRNETRSILFDRPATGWSDVGPFPRTSYREAVELHTLLKNTGETGPVVLVGHSYGGMLSLIYAMHYPENVAGLVLLDPGMAEAYYDDPGALDSVVSTYWVMTLLNSVGIPVNALVEMLVPGMRELNAVYERGIAEAWEEFSQTNRAVRNGYGSVSIFGEIKNPEFFETGLIRPGVLDGIPVSVASNLGGTDIYSQESLDLLKKMLPDDSSIEEEVIKGWLKILDRLREAVFSLSNKVQTYSIPEGNTHNFPYEIPDYVAALVRDMLRRIEDPAAQPTLGANLPHGWRDDTQNVSELTAKSAEATK